MAYGKDCKSKWKVAAEMNFKDKTLSEGLKILQSEEASLPSKVAEFDANIF